MKQITLTLSEEQVELLAYAVKVAFRAARDEALKLPDQSQRRRLHLDTSARLNSLAYIVDAA